MITKRHVFSWKAGIGAGGGRLIGPASFNGDPTADQLFTVGTSGSNFAITNDNVGGHVFNLPDADAAVRGVVTSSSQIFGGQKTLSSAPIFSSLTASTVAYLGSGRALTSSAVTPTELGYVSGVTSALQTQLTATANIDSPTFTTVVNLPATAQTISQPTTSVTQITHSWDITPGGNDGNSRQGLKILMEAGYTGSGFTACLFFRNQSTNDSGINYASNHQAVGVNTTINIGMSCYGINSHTNYGVRGASDTDSVSVTEAGVLGTALNASGVGVAGFFTLAAFSGESLPSVSSALAADNAGTASDIARFYDNGNVKVRIATLGNVVLAAAALATNATNGFTYLPSCAGAPTADVTDFTGVLPAIIDSTNLKIYVNFGGTTWKSATFT